MYRAPHGSDAKYPIVVLVNRNTASAAEIVSGALQDHDRALIVGETTFGKGLVQTVFPISENTGLALTTYHYYTPSGRLIQRNYNDVSLYDYYYVRDDAHAQGQRQQRSQADRLRPHGLRRRRHHAGREDRQPQGQPLRRHDADQHYAFFNFSKHYLATHTVAKDLAVDDAVMQQFKDFLKSEKIDYTDKDLTANLDWVKASIKSELFTSQFGQGEGLRVRAEWDPQINKALTFMPEAQALEDHTLPSQQKTQTAKR